MADSTIPAAITQLVTMFTAALPTVQVVDSGFTSEVQAEYVAVAYPDSDDPAADPAVVFTQDWMGLGALSRSESYDIRCELAAWTGDGLLATRRARVFAMFKACQDALRADPGLSGQISPSGTAQITGGQLADGDTPKGPAARIDFNVQVSNVRI